MFVKLKMMSSTTSNITKRKTTITTTMKRRTSVTTAVKKWVNCLLLLIPTTSVLIGIASLILVPTTRGLTTSIDERGGRKLFGGYRITPKFCRASKSLPKSDPRSNGPTICMFNHECAQRDGQVVGACMDGFLFGACCQLHDDIANQIIQQSSLLSSSGLSQSNLAAAYETYAQQASNEIKTPDQRPSGETISSGMEGEDDGYIGGGGSSSSGGIKIGDSDNSDLSLSSNYYDNNAAIDIENESDQSGIYMSGSNTILDDQKPNDFYANEGSFMLSSSTPNPVTDQDHRISSTTMANVHFLEKDDEDMQSPSKVDYNTEHPMKISTSTYAPTYEDNIDGAETTEMASEAENEEMNEMNEMMSEIDREPLTSITTSGDDDIEEFNQSGITHGEAEAVLMEDDLQFPDAYTPPSSVFVPPSSAPEKLTYEKPIFKPKPQADLQTTPMPTKLTSVEDNYVLVQTITNDKPPSKRPIESITTNDMESIESIILMLNDTNNGPTYNIETSTKVITAPVTHTPTTIATTTQAYHKYDSSTSYGYVTQKTATQKSTSTSTNYPSYASYDNQQQMHYNTQSQTQKPFASTNELEKDEYRPNYESYKPSKRPIYTTNTGSYYDKHEPTHSFSTQTEKPTLSTSMAIYEQYGSKYNTSYSNPTPSYSDKYGSNFPSSRPQKPTYGPYGQQNYGTSSFHQTQRPVFSTSTVNKLETYKPTYGFQTNSKRPALVTSASFAESASAANNLNYVVTSRPINAEISTLRPVTSNRPSIISAQTGYYDNNSGSTYSQFATHRPQTSSSYIPQKDTNLIVSPSDSFASSTFHSSEPSYTRPTTPRPAVTRWPSQDRPTPVQPVIQDNQIIISPTRRPPTHPPTLLPKLPSTSYLMGPTPPRPPSNIIFTTSTSRPSQVYTYQSSPSGNLYTTQFVTSSNYASSTQKLPMSQTYRPTAQDNSYIKVSTTQRPSPTVIITPKPTVNLMTSGSWTQRPSIMRQPSVQTTNKTPPSTSYVFSPLVTKRPSLITTTPPPPTPAIDPASFPVISNDFDDPGYFGTASERPGYDFTYMQSTPPPPPAYTKRPPPRPSYPSYLGTTLPNKPSYSNYYGTTITPGYDSFNVPTASEVSENTEEETYTSPNDFVNFPPVRNPNLNLSATASSVTDEFDISTPSFVEDNVLKEKMNVLVNKIVQSLQGNFEILTNIVEERNNTITSFQSEQLTTTLRPFTTRRTIGTTKRTPSRSSTRTTSRTPTRVQTRTPTKNPTKAPPKTGTKTPSKTPSKTSTKTPAKNPTKTPAKTPTKTSSKAPSKTGTKSPIKTATKPSTVKATTPKVPVTKATKVTSVPPTTKKSQKISTKKPSASNNSKRPSSISPNRATSPKPTKKLVSTTRRPSGTKKVTTVPTKKVQTKLTTIPTKRPGSQGTRRPTKPTRRVPTTTVQQEEEITGETGIEFETSSEDTRQIQCGVRPLVKSGRIVGGKGATFGEWPWQVLVRESTWLGLFTKNKCGGVLITNKFVITAAHCQPGFLASLVAVFGEFDISGDLEERRSVTKNVRRVIVHRQYDAATFENDLALLELESPIHYDAHIVPICMPPDDADYTGRMATVTGWGRLKYGGGVPSVLQEVQVPIIENSVCQEMFHTAGHSKKILPSFLCAGYANGQKDSCEGDSGGPLVIQRDDGRWELVGTVSHGIKCAAPYLPGVYMRTSYYKNWIKSITGVK